jgi:hypothetical protein
MGSKILNGTTVTHGAISITKIKRLSRKEGAKWINITGLSDTTHVYELGKSDCEIQVECVGASAVTHGTKNYLIINYADATNSNTNNMIALVDGMNGSLDGEQSCTITFKQGEA